ncbi:glycosyltransferase [Enterocloster lavalensis]|uniref:glycosyltransferase n=1 Tax=Enterocloster lavalensis TaxID=460384 RepID=UPI001407DE6F|nr:glycosyltransferase [Enterocloster lavalensis]
MDEIGVVIVTYNRLEKLKKAIHSYECQIIQPIYILVINNACTDGSSEYLKKWKDTPESLGYKTGIRRYTITMPSNVGGSGGFYQGLCTAGNLDAKWIFISDDDAYPNSDVFYIFNQFITDYKGQFAALCTSVICNEQIDTWHRRRMIRKMGFYVEHKISSDEYRGPFFKVDLYSFVGSLICIDTLRAAGLPLKDYFISYDDSEHSLRLRKLGDILCIPAAITIHDTNAPTVAFSWKTYYTVRNKLLTYKKHFPVYNFSLLCVYYLIRAIKKEKRERNMVVSAVIDAITEKTGIHPVYQPGWK